MSKTKGTMESTPTIKDERSISEIVTDEIKKNLSIFIEVYPDCGNKRDINVSLIYKGETISEQADSFDVGES